MRPDVRLEIEGSLLERLLERAAARGASFRELRRTGPRSIRLGCDENSARILVSLCERYLLNCRVLRRGGRSELLRRLRARWTILPGLALCALVCALCFSRLWKIDISFTGPCAEMGSEAAIRACIAAQDVHPGMPLGKLDAALLQKQLLAGAGSYSYVGVRVQGVYLRVEAAPEVPSPELFARDYARDLVAARDGVVTAVNVKSGAACVSPGDTVRCGQTLIRGEETVAHDAESGEDVMSPVAALGEVRARCWYEGSAEGSLTERVELPTGSTREEARLQLMGLSLPVTSCESFARESLRTRSQPVVGLFLPLEIRRTTHHELRSVLRPVDPEQLARQLLPLARAEARSRIARDGASGASGSYWTETGRDGDTLRVRAVYEIDSNIAITRDRLQNRIEEVYQPWNSTAKP